MLLVYAFRETMHNAEYEEPSHVFAAADVKNLIAAISKLAENPKCIDEELVRKRSYAMSENAEAYTALITES